MFIIDLITLLIAIKLLQQTVMTCVAAAVVLYLLAVFMLYITGLRHMMPH